ncbi:MAG: RraA family protein [Steroidobacterales bacterium]
MAAQPPALTMRKTFPRPDPAHVGALHGVQSGYVVDARGRKGALDHHIRPLTVNTAFCGVAVTVQTRPRDNLACWAALEACKPGDVLVIACNEYEEASVIGDVFVAMAVNNGVVACVTDGMVRDIAGINQAGIPVFARGLTPNSPFKDGPGEIGLAVVIGGVTVNSGDVIVGDRDGVVVVPQREISAVLHGLEAVRDKEAKMESGVKSGQKVPPWLAEALLHKGIRYVD